MISPTAEYALRAIVAIAQGDGEAVVTPTMARITKVPSGYLPKVLQTLRRAGLVDSKRGLGGGFTLSKAPGELTILEVVNAVDPIKRIERCPLDLGSHGTNLCPLHRRLNDATELVEQAFAKTTIAELLAQRGRSTPLCEHSTSVGVTLGADSIAMKSTRASTRRHDGLIEFSRDHTLGLAVAKHLLEAADVGVAARRKALQEFLSAWDRSICRHFDDEERFLTRLIVEPDRAARLRNEHLALRSSADLARALLERGDPDGHWLRGLGKLLHDHIRWEERELFPYIERSANAGELNRLAKRLAKTRGPAQRGRPQVSVRTSARRHEVDIQK